MQDMNLVSNEYPVNVSNSKKLQSIISENSNITIDYPSATATLSTVKLGNPLYIKLKNLPGLTTLSEPTNNDCEHIDFEDLKTICTFTYFCKVYKKLRK
jgi:hypothetical protein